MHLLKALTTLLLVILALSGCGYEEHPITNEVRKSIDAAGDAIAMKGKEAQDMANEEVVKLFAHEYKVIELDSELSAEEIEGKLNEVGAERWNCFHTDNVEDKLRFYCRRHPRSYLRHALKLL